MAPNSTVTATLTTTDFPQNKTAKQDICYQTFWGSFKTPLIWPNIIGIISVHIITIIGFTTFPYFQHKATFAWCNLHQDLK